MSDVLRQLADDLTLVCGARRQLIERVYGLVEAAGLSRLYADEFIFECDRRLGAGEPHRLEALYLDVEEALAAED